uniref:Inositol monophosphatase 1 n=1 Tax=Lygus hesperus TaxID=30085 RepID=A0A0A9X6Z4_LYGHE
MSQERDWAICSQEKSGVSNNIITVHSLYAQNDEYLFENPKEWLKDDLFHSVSVCRSPELAVTLGSVPVRGMIDSGAVYSCVSEEWVNENRGKLQILSRLPVSKVHVVGAVGNKSPSVKEQNY